MGRGYEKGPPLFPLPPSGHDRRNGITDNEEVKQTLLRLILRQLRVMDVKDLRSAYDQVSRISEAKHKVTRDGKLPKL